MNLSLPDYRIVRKLGQGAASTLYCVEHLDTRELRTAKFVIVNEEDERKFIDQLKAEQAAGQVMSHPVLRKVYELRHLRKRFKLQAVVLMMEYVDGVPMSSSSFHASLPELLHLFRQLAEGLHVMHHAGFVHADLKPGNMLVTPRQEMKLIDFGQSSPLLEAKERIQGTIDYMAPEQARRSVLDQRTDVFGLGATLYRILTGRAIATEMNRTAGLHAPSRIGKRLSELNRASAVTIPICVQKFIEDCCRDEPVHRLADMRAVVSRIDLTRTILEHQTAAEPDNGTQVGSEPVPHSRAGTDG